VIEEAAPGLLGQHAKTIAWDTKASCRIDAFSLQDAFLHTYGSHGDLLAAHGLDLATIAAKLGLA
jgi:transketolase